MRAHSINGNTGYIVLRKVLKRRVEKKVFNCGFKFFQGKKYYRKTKNGLFIKLSKALND